MVILDTLNLRSAAAAGTGKKHKTNYTYIEKDLFLMSQEKENLLMI